MSATLDSKLFSDYFSFIVDGGLVSAPVIQVEGKAFPVKELYLEDFAKPEEVSVALPARSLSCKNLPFIDDSFGRGKAGSDCTRLRHVSKSY